MQQVSLEIERGSFCAEQSVGNDRDIRLLLRRAAHLCRIRLLAKVSAVPVSSTFRSDRRRLNAVRKYVTKTGI
jgi:hypothetical protein